MVILLWIVTAIASAFIGLLVTVLFQDQASVLLVKTLQGFRGGNNGRTLSGVWYSYYYIFPESGTSPTARIPSTTIITVRLRQVGNHVAGTGVGSSVNYSTLAILQDPYLTGSWRNLTEGHYSWGAFQLSWHTNNKWMIGKFVGKDSYNHINHGIWLWVREREELPALADWAKKSGYSRNISEVHECLNVAWVLSRLWELSLSDHQRSQGDGAPAPPRPLHPRRACGPGGPTRRGAAV